MAIGSVWGWGGSRAPFFPSPGLPTSLPPCHACHAWRRAAVPGSFPAWSEQEGNGSWPDSNCRSSLPEAMARRGGKGRRAERSMTEQVRPGGRPPTGMLLGRPARGSRCDGGAGEGGGGGPSRWDPCPVGESGRSGHTYATGFFFEDRANQHQPPEPAPPPGVAGGHFRLQRNLAPRAKNRGKGSRFISLGGALTTQPSGGMATEKKYTKKTRKKNIK